MSPQRQGDGPWRIYLPTPQGTRKLRSTGTHDKRIAAAMERMVTALGYRGSRDWDLLEAVLAGQLTIGELYDADQANTLAALRARLDDIDLLPYIDRWQDWLTGRVKPDTKERYRVHLATLHQGQPWLRSSLTPDAVDRWLAQIDATAGTKRKYYAALGSFLEYLKRIRVPVDSPLVHVAPPPAAMPRVVFLELTDVERVVSASQEPYRTLFALLYGTGMDLSTALGLRKRDVDRTNREIRAAGTKSHARDRVVAVADWAWPYVEALVAALTPSAPLFPAPSRWTASDYHRARLEALGLRGSGRDALRLHDARHHWAVRMIRAGTPIELVARQLGHVDGTLALRVYGRFVPRTEDRQRWESKATAMEKKRRGLTTILTTDGKDRRDAAS